MYYKDRPQADTGFLLFQDKNMAGAVFLFPFTFGLYFIPESPPWLVYNDEEDLAFKSVVLVRGEEYDASIEIRRIKESLERHKNDLHALLLDERLER